MPHDARGNKRLCALTNVIKSQGALPLEEFQNGRETADEINYICQLVRHWFVRWNGQEQGVGDPAAQILPSLIY